MTDKKQATINASLKMEYNHVSLSLTHTHTHSMLYDLNINLIFK